MNTPTQVAAHTAIFRAILFSTGALLLLAVFVSCEKKVETSAVLPDREPSVAINDSLYTVDSARTVKNWDLLWEYVFSGKNWNVLNQTKGMTPIIEHLLAYKYDSTIYMIYTDMFSAEGRVLAKMGRPDEGRQLVRKAYSMITNKFGENHINNIENCIAISNTYKSIGDYDHAIEWQKKALRLADNVFKSDHYYFRILYHNIALIYQSKKDYPNALEFFNKVFRYCQKLGERDGTIIVNLEIADILLESGDVNAAEKIILEQIERRDALHINNDIFSSCASIMLADIYLEKGDTALSRKYLRISTYFLKKLQSAGHYYALAILERTGAYYAKKREFKTAIAYYQKVVNSHLQNSGPAFSEGIRCKNEIGRLLLQLKDYPAALDCFQHSLEMQTTGALRDNRNKNPAPDQLIPTPLLLVTLTGKAKTCLALSQTSAGNSYLEVARNTADLALILLEGQHAILQWEGSKLTASEQQHNLVETALDILEKYNLPEDQKADRALQIIEKYKAATLRERLHHNNALATANIPSDLRQMEDSLRYNLAFYYNRTLELAKSEKPDSLDVNTCHYKLVQFKEAYDSLVTAIEHENPEYHQINYGLNTVCNRDVQRLLHTPETALLEYFWGDSTLYAYSVSTSGAKFVAINIDTTLYRNCRDMLSWSQKPEQLPAEHSTVNDFRDFTHVSSNLYRKILKPILPAQAERLIIIPDGSLGNLPFQLLLEEDPDQQVLAAENWRDLPYLIKTKDIRYEYSAALLLEPPPHHKHRQLYAGFAPAFSGQPLASRGIDSAVVYRHWRGGAVPGLRQNRPEVEAVQSLLGAGNAFLAEAATEQAFKQYAPGCSVLHLATHACADDEDPLYSQILFSHSPTDTADDGALHAYELYNMRLDADLAVLSACQTGAGRVQRGEGVMSLSRAFKYAGCPNIVMSLWNADDEASKTIVVDFFKNLKAGLGKDAALCQAQRNYLDSATLEQAHPSRWATFVLVGDDSPVAFSSAKWLVVLFTLGLSALILYGFFWRSGRN